MEFGAKGGKDGNATMAKPSRPKTTDAQIQVWAKPQPAGKLAVYVVNPSPSGKAAAVTVDFATLGLPPTVTGASVRDVWSRQEVGPTAGASLKLTVEPLDSAFVLLTPL